jgi:hypothetical protein
MHHVSTITLAAQVARQVWWALVEAAALHVGRGCLLAAEAAGRVSSDRPSQAEANSATLPTTRSG